MIVSIEAQWEMLPNTKCILAQSRKKFIAFLCLAKTCQDFCIIQYNHSSKPQFLFYTMRNLRCLVFLNGKIRIFRITLKLLRKPYKSRNFFLISIPSGKVRISEGSCNSFIIIMGRAWSFHGSSKNFFKIFLADSQFLKLFSASVSTEAASL